MTNDVIALLFVLLRAKVKTVMNVAGIPFLLSRLFASQGKITVVVSTSG